ncbi:NAD(P)-dependent dehydrogenase (short-subunit alcohol dehydrogenase family) [Crossiella equi]|uniref:NAD(P)-dependent dehydrogenase (Short-subunit alcohol dehydrogenase family) n=1 Tax=Crossiella equi TaxID=130796 RepID=A0ABS5AS73_9PSEU|nr:SDR family NAD(P)-dependent oxidoreductase [Crossiella equi]MBP2479415.1 NAD(P)-dependent dehydrogenase (short-subunit alcohol dehydrogenase family) [Crossiella equi]
MRSLENRTVVITGASAGIGAAAARQLVATGADLVLVGRSPERTERVAAETGARWFTADFARLVDVRRLAEDLRAACPAVHVLVNNAGAINNTRTRTEDGHELTIQANHLAPFLLTHLLADRLPPGARVVTTSSGAHAAGRLDVADLSGERLKYRPLAAYAASKLANLLFAQELARRTRLVSVACHPGAVASDFFRGEGLVSALMRSPLGRLLTRTAEQGAEPLVRAVTAPAETVNGAYLTPRGSAKPKGDGNNAALASALWTASRRALDLTEDPFS